MILEKVINTIRLATTPKVLRAIHPDALWQVQTDEKVVYLTFDDGPIPDVTNKVLDLLDQYQAKATFFCIGENVELYPKLYQTVLEKGHAVGNHTYNHINGKQTGDDIYYHNIAECAKHVNSKLFRPPFGQLKKSQYQVIKKDYKIVMWSNLSWDFDDKLSPGQCANKVLQHIKNGSIIVFHDSVKAAPNSIPALQIVLEDLTKKGFHFLSLDHQ